MGVGAAVSRALCPREEGIQQEWCWAEFWSFEAAGKERRSLEVSFAGLGVMSVSLIRWNYWRAIASLTSPFQDDWDADNWGHCCSTGCIRTGFVLSTLYWHRMFSSHVIPFILLLFLFIWLVGCFLVSWLLFNLFTPLPTLLLLQPCPR